MPNQDRIFRLLSKSEGFFKDRGSKFHSYAYSIQSQEEAMERVAELKKKYHDARHHCFAYRLGEGGEQEFATDDGEPSHSAGDPILGAIRSASLTWTLVVVVRYFGGTKLGIRGLIEAYRTAAEEALTEAPKEEIIATVRFKLQYTYPQTSAIKRILHPFELEIVESIFTDVCLQIIQIREEFFPNLENQLTQAGFLIEVEEDSA